MDAIPSYLDRLFASGLLVATGVDGLYGRSAAFDDVLERVAHRAGDWGRRDGAELLRFPPAMPRATLVTSGYLKSFPQLAGSIHAFCGNDAAHREMLRCIAVGEDWSQHQGATDAVLTPAACYPVYGLVGRRGPVPEGGVLIDLRSWCFRHEPSVDPARMQMFQMREYVCIGSGETVLAARQRWLADAPTFFERLMLPYALDVANDPFFGRTGRVLADSQRSQKLKFELLVPINQGAAPTACMSFNYHGEHFGDIWDIRQQDGSLAQSGCVGFGLERITLALFRHHGLDPAAWPEKVRATLWGDA